MASTTGVLDHHIKCFGECDLAGILSDYASDAVLFTPEGPLKGPDAIRPFFEAMLAEFGKPGTSFSMFLFPRGWAFTSIWPAIGKEPPTR